jgi:hypothetical protein
MLQATPRSCLRDIPLKVSLNYLVILSLLGGFARELYKAKWAHRKIGPQGLSAAIYPTCRDHFHLWCILLNPQSYIHPLHEHGGRLHLSPLLNLLHFGSHWFSGKHSQAFFSFVHWMSSSHQLAHKCLRRRQWPLRFPQASRHGWYRK